MKFGSIANKKLISKKQNFHQNNNPITAKYLKILKQSEKADLLTQSGCLEALNQQIPL